MNDTIPDIDGISLRINRDTVKNSHGECFMDFLKDNKLCVLNGRVTPTLDDYTYHIWASLWWIILQLIMKHCNSVLHLK